MTWTIKTRRAGGPMLAEYECPEHGRFEAVVDRDASGDPPASARCPHIARASSASMFPNSVEVPCAVGRRSPWRISAPAVHTQFVVSATQGKSAPHREAMDTRPLTEGRKNEWRRERKRIKEERRHKRVKELLR